MVGDASGGVVGPHRGHGLPRPEARMPATQTASSQRPEPLLARRGVTGLRRWPHGRLVARYESLCVIVMGLCVSDHRPSLSGRSTGRRDAAAATGGDRRLTGSPHYPHGAWAAGAVCAPCLLRRTCRVAPRWRGCPASRGIRSGTAYELTTRDTSGGWRCARDRGHVARPLDPRTPPMTTPRSHASQSWRSSASARIAPAPSDCWALPCRASRRDRLRLVASRTSPVPDPHRRLATG